MRHAWRVLRRHPAFTSLLVTVFAVGVAGLATMFRLLDGVLLQPPAGVADVQHIDRLTIERSFPEAGLQRSTYMSYPLFAFLRDQLTAFDHVAAYTDVPLSLDRGPSAEEVRAQLATGEYFAILGAHPLIGRFFTTKDDRLPVGTPVAVLSFGFWQRRFGGRKDVVGTRLALGNWIYTVVGISRPEFHGIDYGPVDVWVPLSTAAASSILGDWSSNTGSMWLQVITHRSHGITRQVAEQRASALYRQYLVQQSTNTTRARVVLGMVPGPTDPRVAKNARFAILLAAIAVLVFIASLANITILQLARGSSRARELATRKALGAHEGQIARQLLIEAAGPTVLGAIASAILAALGVRRLHEALFATLEWPGGALDARTWAVIGVLALVLALAGAAAPVLHAWRTSPATELRAAGHGVHPLPRRTGFTLIMLQAVLAMILLAVAGLFSVSLRRALTVNLGFNADSVVVVQLTGMDVAGPNASHFPRQRVRALYHDAYERSRALLNVSNAALSLSIPFTSVYGSDLKVPGHEPLPSSATGGPYINAVTGSFFGTIGAQFLAGRTFSRDSATAQREIVVNETMARMIWSSPQKALGNCVIVANEPGCRTVIGVIRDIKQMSIDEAPMMQFFVPLAGSGWTPRNVLVRLRRDQPGAIEAIRNAVQSVAPDLPFARITSLRSFLEPQLEPLEVGKFALTMASGLALAVAGLGLYSVLVFSISAQRHEIGIRLALGASRSGAVLGILRDGLAALLVGLILGVAIVLLSQGILSRFLFDTSAGNVEVLGGAALILCITGLVAGAIPAARATHLDPAIVLREE